MWQVSATSAKNCLTSSTVSAVLTWRRGESPRVRDARRRQWLSGAVARGQSEDLHLDRRPTVRLLDVDSKGGWRRKRRIALVGIGLNGLGLLLCRYYFFVFN